MVEFLNGLVGGALSGWNVTSIRIFQDWEVEEVNAFFALLYSHAPDEAGE